MEIGEDVVKKCGGVPLAIATVGSLLRLKRELHDWLYVRDNHIWKLMQGDDGILPALKLSYDALPPYLKPCFAYCSLFPKDYEFYGLEMIPLWMAEGFISPIQNQGIFEMGMGYIGELCSRCFFEKSGEYEYGLYAKFKMHDLIHDLAISMSQVDCSSMNFRPSVALERVRHVSLSTKDLNDGEGQVAGSILQLGKVRTILFPKYFGDVAKDQSFCKACISRFKYLRVLDMRFSVDLKVLPSSVGNLSHLRYLNISYNNMIEKLPDSICNLHNLQPLDLWGCGKLKELPKDIGNLISLVHLVITTQQMYLPKGIKCLTSLQSLSFGGCFNLKSLGDVMQSFTNLRGFSIYRCHNLEYFPLNDLKYLAQLQTIQISDCCDMDLMMDSEEGIRSLRQFTISQPNLEALPRWLHDSAHSLQFLSIYDCENMPLLPEWLQDFKLLQRVVIADCPKLLAMPERMHHLTALRELYIRNCPELIKRCNKEEGADWPKIAHVTTVVLNGVDIALVDKIEETESSV